MLKTRDCGDIVCESRPLSRKITPSQAKTAFSRHKHASKGSLENIHTSDVLTSAPCDHGRDHTGSSEKQYKASMTGRLIPQC